MELELMKQSLHKKLIKIEEQINLIKGDINNEQIGRVSAAAS